MITTLLKSLSRALLSIVLILTLMLLLPLFSEMQNYNKDKLNQPKQIIRRVKLIKEEETPQKKQLHLRASKASRRESRSTEQFDIPFTPDLSVGTEEGAAIEMADLTTTLFEENEIDIPPKAIYLEPLHYPERAREAEIEGTVSMIILIGREGRVERVDFEKLPSPIFRRPLERQIMRWRFEPGIKEGVPVRVKVRQSVDFNLD